MVAPERQRQGLGDVLFRTWDRNVGASLGLGLSESSYRLFQKTGMAGCRSGAVPRQAAEPPRAAASRTGRQAVNRLVSYVTLPWIRLVSRTRPLEGEVTRHAPLRRALHPPLGTREGQVRVRRAARCARTSTGSTSSRRTSATRSPCSNAARTWPATSVYRHVQEPRGTRDAAGGLSCRSGRHARHHDAAALDRSRSPRRRLRQDPDVRHARGLPQAPEEVRLLHREVDDGVRRQGECGDGAGDFLQGHRAAGT